MEKRKMITFPEIGQFRQIIKVITDNTRYSGKDENGDAIFDASKRLPTLTFTGTVKLHGTNAGVTLTKNGDMYPQSRENVISMTSDNAGFAFFVETNKDVFRKMFSTLDIRDADYITIFGEWAGGNIQKSVAISGLPKMFVIFAVKLSYEPNEEGVAIRDNYFYTDEETKHLKNPETRIYNILDFENYSIDIDFENPHLAQNKLIELTLAVEEQCPVGKFFGNIGVGEGICWKCETSKGTLRFKVKGDAHAGKSKVKTLKPVDNEKINKLQEVAMKVTPAWRLSQMLEKSCNLMNGGQIDRAKLGEYLKLVINDVIKEDIDILVEEGTEIKDISKYISEIAKRYFFEQESI